MLKFSLKGVFVEKDSWKKVFYEIINWSIKGVNKVGDIIFYYLIFYIIGIELFYVFCRC